MDNILEKECCIEWGNTGQDGPHNVNFILFANVFNKEILHNLGFTTTGKITNLNIMK
jgi:hypothetical protein